MPWWPSPKRARGALSSVTLTSHNAVHPPSAYCVSDFGPGVHHGFPTVTPHAPDVTRRASSFCCRPVLPIRAACPLADQTGAARIGAFTKSRLTPCYGLRRGRNASSHRFTTLTRDVTLPLLSRTIYLSASLHELFRRRCRQVAERERTDNLWQIIAFGCSPIAPWAIAAAGQIPRSWPNVQPIRKHLSTTPSCLDSTTSAIGYREGL